MGDDDDNSFTLRRWSEMEEAVRSRTEDMNKLQLIGRPLLSNDEPDESSDSKSEYESDGSNSKNESNEPMESNNSESELE